MAKPFFKVAIFKPTKAQTAAFKKELDHAVSRAVYDVADQVFARSQELAPIDQSTLRKSGTVSYGPGPQATIDYSAAHAAPVHFGSRPHMPPVEPLIEWARRNAIEFMGQVFFKGEFTRGRRGKPTGEVALGEQEARRIGWAIAKKIAKEGTKATPFLQRAIDEVIPMLPEAIKYRIRGAVKRYVRP